MAATVPNFDILLSGILRDARRQQDPVAHLDALHRAAWAAVQAGDEYVTMTSDEGGSNTAERGIAAVTLLQLYELALQAVEAEAKVVSGTSAASSDVRIADFSQQPSVMG